MGVSRVAQSVQHTQCVLEIDALAILQLGPHADGDPYASPPDQLPSLLLPGLPECGRPVGEWCESSRAKGESDQEVVAPSGVFSEKPRYFMFVKLYSTQ